MKILLLPLVLLTAWGGATMSGTALGPRLPSSPTTALAGLQAFDFSRPAASYSMPPELAELSGIAVSGPDEITGVEDETGRLYHYSLRTRGVVRVSEFASAGDYEDVARVGNDWFVMRSDGTLFRYSGTRTQRYNTGLTVANNVEGLTYDPHTKTLLVACKGAPGGELTATKRVIYRLHPEKYTVETPAAYVLPAMPAIGAAMAGSTSPTVALPSKKSKKGGMGGFAPSAVAMHPRTRHVFVLSARQNGLVELDAAGRLVAAQALPPALFPQAEGMTFTPGGDLYIATEAGNKSGTAMIHLFRPQH